MKTIVLKLALAALALLTAAIALYIVVYVVVFGGMILAGFWLSWRAGRLHQRFLAWNEQRIGDRAAREEAEAHYAAEDARAAAAAAAPAWRMVDGRIVVENR